MAILLYETLDNIPTSVSGSVPSDISVSEASMEHSIDPGSIMVDIEAIHALPHATRNYTRYTEKCLKNSIPGWTKPYNKPLITHHNEKNGDIIGRVVDASLKTAGTFSGTPALLLTVNVPGEQAKADIKNGLNQTVSIGVTATDVRCSVCGKQIELDSDGEVISCEHKKGHTYGKETAFWDIHAMEPKEVSYVVVPSDIFAGNVKNYPAAKNKLPAVKETYKEEGKQSNMDIKEMETKLKSAEDRASNFEASFKAITETKESLETKLADANKNLEETSSKLALSEAANKELVTKIETLEAKVTELNTKISDLENKNKDISDKLADETKMRECLETELSSTKISLKESLVDTLQSLRKLNGKVELDSVVLREREESSIRDSIADLKLEMKETTEQQKVPGTIPNPALSEEAAAPENQSVNLKENSKNSDAVDLKLGLETLFMAVAGARK